MGLLCKQKALYIKCCIIANGVMDSQGDTLYTEDIRKIFTSFNNQDNFEIYHNDLPIEEVSLLENYISTADEMIGTDTVPKGSWMAVIRVDNPDIQNSLLNNEFKGVSLNNRLKESCKANLHGQIRYKDVADAECVIPLRISFVQAGANGYGLHVMDYEAYIHKSKKKDNGGNKNMSFNLLKGLKDLVQQAEADSETEPVIQKSADEKGNGVKPVIKKEDKPDETNKEDEPVITKEIDDEELEAKIRAIVEKILAEKQEETNDDKKEEDSSNNEDNNDEPKIQKSRVIQTTEETQTPETSNYFELTNRDPLTGLPKQ